MSSRMYRELKLRGCAVQRKEFNTLPLEHVIATVEGVWNLSSDQVSWALDMSLRICTREIISHHTGN